MPQPLSYMVEIMREAAHQDYEKCVHEGTIKRLPKELEKALYGAVDRFYDEWEP